MRFVSDNAASAHDAVLNAVLAANAPDAAYDGDRLSAQLDGAFSALFECDVTALCVSSGTAANCLALAALCPSYGAIICQQDSHIQNHEAGAPEFFTNGAKLLPLSGEGGKLTPDGVAAQCGDRSDVHRVHPHALSIANATEWGRVYAPDEVSALGELAKECGLGFHMDGARFANAVAHLGCTPAALTWRAGVDALSFGFVKNGGISAEVLIFFRPQLAEVTRIRRKRAGLLLSKGRFAAAQVLALLEDNLWLEAAGAANTGAARIGAALPTRVVYPVQANEVFLRLDASETATLRASGFEFFDWGEGIARFVVSWDQPSRDIDQLVSSLSAIDSNGA